MSVILSQSEVILRRERSAEEYKNVLTAILAASKLMSEIVQKLLALERFGTDRFELKMGDTDLRKIIYESVKLLTPVAEQKGISIKIRTGETYTVRGDREALLELFVNIIDNAIKYNVPGGRIDVAFRKEEDFLVTEIRDTGIGIPKEDLEKVFDRFYRVDKSRSKEAGGMGLGLSIARWVA